MKRKVTLLIILIIIIFLVILLNYDNILKWRYDVAVKDKNCEKIYDIVDIENGNYLTKEKFVQQCELKINNYDNSKIEVHNHKIKNEIVNIYNNIKFYIPTDSKFYLDGNLISSNFVSDEYNIYNIFTLDKVFEGEYSVEFNNKTSKENNKIIIAENDLEQIYEYNNPKQLVTVIGHDYCSFCSGLLEFLSTLDNNIFDIKYYNLYVDGHNKYNKETERVSNDFYQHFNVEVDSYPTVIIGDKYILGYSNDMEQKYIDSIYNAYRNKIETVIK